MSRNAFTGQKSVNLSLELALHEARKGLATCAIEIQPGMEPFEKFELPEELFSRINIFPAVQKNKVQFDSEGSAARALELARLAMLCGKYDLVILDEAQSALEAGCLTKDDIQRLRDLETNTIMVVF